jgi:8-oxo-dGTP pyrophosphatase MutT (NUDIX family)
MAWHALRAALAGAETGETARLPFFVGGCRAGSVAAADLPALGGWPEALRIDAHGVSLVAPAPAWDATLALINHALREQGLVRGWRDEPFALVDPASGRRLARIERAAARFWGTLTLGAHANGYVADRQGRPDRLWIAQRALNKATDPGRFDNLVGGGVPDGQTPWQALLREGWEEAGLDAAQMQTARPGRVLRLRRPVPEGWQVEDLHGYDLALPPGQTPINQDGEVQAFVCLPMAEALALAAGPTMTVDAALVTLDFALRHGLFADEEAAEQARALAPLFAGLAQRDQSP